VAVVGGGESAGEGSLALTRFVDKVTLLVRGDKLKTSQLIADKIESSPKIDVQYHTEIQALKGRNKLRSVTLENNQTGQTERITPAAVFVFVGMSPNGDWFPESIDRNEAGFILTGPTLETSLPGVFAAGDVRQGATNQAAAAVGEGATAALMIRSYLKQM
jgi:thioredoxin reductase (NADPH)